MDVVNFQELTALGALLLGYVFLLRWLIMSQTHILRHLTEEIQVLTVTVLNLQKSLIRHDAQVRGINPSVGGDQPERDREAIRVYAETMKEIGQLIQLIEKRMSSRS